MATWTIHSGEGGFGFSDLIDQRLAELGDWRGEALAHARRAICDADPAVTETITYSRAIHWMRAGRICIGEADDTLVKLVFAKGASLEDAAGLFNAGLDDEERRVIEIREGDAINAEALETLVRAAVALNLTTRTAVHRQMLQDDAGAGSDVVFRMLVGRERRPVEFTRAEFASLIEEIEKDGALVRSICDQARDDIMSYRLDPDRLPTMDRPCLQQLPPLIKDRTAADRSVILAFLVDAIQNKIFFDHADKGVIESLGPFDIHLFSFRGVPE